MGVQQLVIGDDQILGVPAARGVPVPLLGEEPARLVVEPVHVGGPGHGARQQDHLGDPVRVALRVGESQCHAPRATPDQPAVDAEVLAQLLDITDQVLGGIAVQAGAQVRHLGRAPPAAALVELDEAVGLRVEVPPPSRRQAAAGPAVQRHGRLAVRVAADLPVDALTVTDVQHSRVVRLNGRKPLRHDDHGSPDPGGRSSGRYRGDLGSGTTDRHSGPGLKEKILNKVFVN